MHFQSSTPNWTTALLEMPDGAVFKGFDMGLLRKAKETWAAAGRDSSKLITVLRHHDVYTAPEGSWEDAKAHWRAMYARWADGSFFDQGLYRFVDIVSESNEYTAWTTWADLRESAKAHRNVAAAADVWNESYRGRNGIPDHVRVALLAGPVSNGWPRSITQIAVNTDSYLDYHAYVKCINGVRAADDWRNHSGLWEFIEQEQGLKPRWLFGESGPYFDATLGWRADECLGRDEDKLVSVMEAWWLDIQRTAAYREGRIAGPGCWFTSGNVEWPYYQLETEQLIKLARSVRSLWKPGDYDMTDKEKLERIELLANEIAALARSIQPKEWWETVEPPYVVKARTLPLTTYKAPNGSIHDVRPNATYDINVTFREGDWLRVTPVTSAPLWVKAQDVVKV